MKNIFLCLLCSLPFFTGACGEKADLQAVHAYMNAQEEFSNGNFKEAAAILHNEKKFHPSLTLRAKAQYFMNDIDNAEESFRQAIKQRPSSYEAKLYLARVLREKGETEKVKKLIEGLLADHPHDVQLLRFTANNALDQGNVAEAFALLNQAVEMSAESAMVLLDRARLFWVSGRWEEALEDLSKAKVLLPFDSPFARSINQLEKRILEAVQ